MVNSAIQRAIECLKRHPMLEKLVSVTEEQNGCVVITYFKVNLPSRFSRAHETPWGVRDIEPVIFTFSNNFPFTAPKIRLRDDFSRKFPHINPSAEGICPCIYFGSLDNLLTHPRWFDGCLDQLLDWLTRAARNELMNYSQGWEPRLMYHTEGYFYMYPLSDHDYDSMDPVSQACVNWADYDNMSIFVEGNSKDGYKNKIDCFFMKSENHEVSEEYDTAPIRNINELSKFAERCKIQELREKIKKDNLRFSREKLVIVTVTRRPVKLISRDSHLEINAFLVVGKWHKKNHKLQLDAPVKELRQENFCSPEILRRFSNYPQSASEKKILQIGCGSLGSKIAMHLGRSGLTSFSLIDNGFWSGHNNTRHACYANPLDANFKSVMLGRSLACMGISVRKLEIKKIQDSDCLQQYSDFIIDSTATPAVRDWLVYSKDVKGRIIHTALYDNGRVGIVLVEGKDRNPRLDDLLGWLCQKALEDSFLKDALFRDTTEFTPTGTGCGSLTIKASDQRISLIAAGMAGFILKLLNAEIGFEDGMVLIGRTKDDMEVSWQRYSIAKTEIIHSPDSNEKEIRILKNVAETIASSSKGALPKEAGGGLIGRISESLQCITVTSTIPPPADSTSSRCSFVLGTEGLAGFVKKILTESRGELSYLGTWHSHPLGGGPSIIDNTTKTTLVDLRAPEPTVCLLYSGNSFTCI